MIENEESTIQLVVFLLCDEYYAFYAEYIQEIVPVTTITYIPDMPAYWAGAINVRGEIESVLDLRRALALPPGTLTRHSRVAIGQVGELRSGILVDAVQDVLEVPEDAIYAPAAPDHAVETAYIMGESVYKSQRLVLLDVEKIFNTMLNI